LIKKNFEGLEGPIGIDYDVVLERYEKPGKPFLDNHLDNLVDFTSDFYITCPVLNAVHGMKRSKYQNSGLIGSGARLSGGADGNTTTVGRVYQYK
jgi:hypothetical protein